MKLEKLLKNIDYELKSGNCDKNITEIEYDSRKIKKDNLFIAIQGFETDGHLYLKQAIENGAAAVIIEKEIKNYNPAVTYLKVENSRKIMAQLAKKFFDNPLQDINLIGITGTNGKTTTAYLLYNILKKHAGQAALFGTIKNVIGNNELDSKRTTAESLDLYRYFFEMREKNISYAVMEVSSHALDLYRVAGMNFKIAIFTNVSPEHLDYHKTFKNYIEVKSKLFSGLKKNQKAVINIDDPNAEYISQKSNGENYSYSLDSKQADLYALKYNLNQNGMNFKTGGKLELTFKLSLGGFFNIYNSLAAILAADLLGVKSNIIKNSLAEIDSVPGRFEIINAGQNFQIIVDYAHTPDGMKNVLETATILKRNRLIVLFGCGGDRDRSKRPEMAKLAEKYADYIIVSNDNPRSEDPQRIFSEIKNGFSNDLSNYQIIADRKKAIKKAIEMARADDIVMLLGRGHEKYQVFNNKKIELDDRKVAYQIAANRKGK